MSDVRSDTAPATDASARSNPHGNVIWYELMTPDPDGAKAFYDAVVGWDIEPEPTGEAVMDYRMIRRSDGGNAGGVLRITEEMASHGARPGWLCYIDVADVDSKAESIDSAGGHILMPPTDIQGVGRIAMASDPQGAPFYIMTPKPPAGDPGAKSDVFSADSEQRVGWNELSTGDPAGAREFYGGQFGWTSDDFMPMGEMGDYRFWDHGGQRLGAFCQTMPGQPTRWRFYFRVPSIAEAKSKIEQGAGTVTNGPMEVPGGDHIVIGIDPQGAEFALVGKA